MYKKDLHKDNKTFFKFNICHKFISTSNGKVYYCKFFLPLYTIN